MSAHEKLLIEDLKNSHWRNSILAAIAILGGTEIGRPMQEIIEEVENRDPLGFEPFADFWRSDTVSTQARAFQTHALLAAGRLHNIDFTDLIDVLFRQAEEVQELFVKTVAEWERGIPRSKLVQ